ncbi:MAG: ribonuclease III [Acidobacteria bacterium]|nr:ribonuclease III [Acidobacteriota bacterium]
MNTSASDPVVVFRTHSDIEANIVKGLLDAHDIDAMLSSDVPHSILPLTVDGLGEVRVTVAADDADAAVRLIADYQDQGERGRVVRICDEFEGLQDALAYRFHDRGLLEHALTHRSRANEDVTGGVADNESLEFLGDAVLGFVIAELLFQEFPDRDEGQKSKMKAALVSTTTLARQAEQLGLGDHLLLGRGEEKTGGRRKQALLADGYEALIAALYLDGGMDAARTFIVREFVELLAEVAGAVTIGDDHKSALQEALQGRGDPLPDYVVTAEDGPAHRRLFRIDVRLHGTTLASAEGRTKKEAEQEAARRAIESLSRP